MSRRSFYGLLSTVALSSFGDAFGLLAMEWLVYGLTGSKLAMGTLALCSGIPELVLRLIGSPLSDRLPRGRLMAVLAATRLVAILLPLVAGMAGQLQLWHLFAAAALSGSCAALFMPTAMALVPEVADPHKLMRYFAIIDGARNTAALIGPALAGAMTAASGSLSALGINGVCYTAAIIMLLFLPKGDAAKKSQSAFVIRAYLRDIFEGFSFYKQFPAMLTIMVLVSISNLSSVAIWTMMVPYVREVLRRDAAAMGSLSTVTALGALAGLTIISLLPEIKQRRFVMIGSLAVMGVCNGVLSLVHSLPIVIVALFVTGAAGPFFSSLSSSLHGKLVPSHLQGRVNAIRFLIGGGLQPLGAFAGSVIAQHYGIQAMILGAGLLPVLSACAASFFSGLKALNGDLSAPMVSGARCFQRVSSTQDELSS